MDTGFMNVGVERIVSELGGDMCGFADVSGIQGSHPAFPRAVSIGVRLLDTVIDDISSGPTMVYYHHYRTINALLDQIALRTAKHIEGRGWKALPVPASQTIDAKNHFALFQHKTAAVRAGLGWIGRSALFVSPRFGPRIRLATVLTDAPLNTSASLHANGCDNCNTCANLCPAGAIKGETWKPDGSREDIYDAHKCSDYMRANFSGIGRGSVCGICVSACPYGRK